MNQDLVPVQAEPVKPKKIGGATGRGWLPGQSGNPKGAPRRPKEFKLFVSWLREWLLKKEKIQDKDGKIRTATRLETILDAVAKQHPEILLYYAFGKPAEQVQLEHLNAGQVSLVVKVSKEEAP